MSYILVVYALSMPALQVGPFDNVFACEQAAAQIAAATPYNKHAKTVCINLKAKPHHWNGKELPK